MKRHHSLAARLSAFAIATAALSACGAPDDGSPAGPSTAVAQTSTATSADARVRAYLDSNYRRSDVRHGFRTRFAEDIDCVDFYAQQGVRALVAAGLPVLSPAAVTTAAPPEGGVVSSFDGSPDENGNARRCPDGTVPILRTSPDEIARAGGLDSWLARRQKHHGPMHSAAAPDFVDAPNYYHAIGVNSTSMTNVQGGKMTTHIWNPIVQNPVTGCDVPNPPANCKDHSISQLWLSSSANGLWTDPNDTSCSAAPHANCVQTVEFGWNVDVYLYKDGGDDGNGPTHLFTYFTADGYHQTGCYNLGCGFVLLSGGGYTPGQLLGFTPSNHEITLQVSYFSQGSVTGWMYNVNGTSIGYYPTSLFNNGYGGTKPLTRWISGFETGGEVWDNNPRPHTAMGTGVSATTGWSGTGDWTGAAYHRNLQYLTTSWQNALLNPAATRTAWYPEAAPAAGGSNWGTYYYFGGPGSP